MRYHGVVEPALPDLRLFFAPPPFWLRTIAIGAFSVGIFLALWRPTGRPICLANPGVRDCSIMVAASSLDNALVYIRPSQDFTEGAVSSVPMCNHERSSTERIVRFTRFGFRSAALDQAIHWAEGLLTSSLSRHLFYIFFGESALLSANTLFLPFFFGRACLLPAVPRSKIT